MSKTNYNKISKKSESIEPIMETTSLGSVEVVADVVETESITVTNSEKVVTKKKPEKKIKKGVVVDCVKLNVRNNPHPNAAIELTIDKGTEVEITDSVGEFYCVRKGTTTEGFTGWCMKKFISVQ
jgi:uncharacterized protein YgiM (DUF1202 family)